VECERKSDTFNNRATGTVSKSLRQSMTNILGKYEIKELQKQSYWALHTYYGKY